MTTPATKGRDLPPELARRLDELIASGDVEGYLALLRETDDRPAPLDAEPDALYPGGHTTARMTTGERVRAAALVGPWLACATGWAVVVTAHRVVRWALR
jgi:hypothetical protein